MSKVASQGGASFGRTTGSNRDKQLSRKEYLKSHRVHGGNRLTKGSTGDSGDKLNEKLVHNKHDLVIHHTSPHADSYQEG